MIDADGDVGIIQTTFDHPFWNVTARDWTKAGELPPGAELLTPDGDTVKVQGLHTYAGSRETMEKALERMDAFLRR